MLVAMDIDGCLDADPVNMGSLMAALKGAGHRIAILTGASGPPTQADVEAKRNYLNELGMGALWDTLVVLPRPPHKAKARWVRRNGVDLMFDNTMANAKHASKYCTVLMPFNTLNPPRAKEVS